MSEWKPGIQTAGSFAAGGLVVTSDLGDEYNPTIQVEIKAIAGYYGVSSLDGMYAKSVTALHVEVLDGPLKSALTAHGYSFRGEPSGVNITTSGSGLGNLYYDENLDITSDIAGRDTIYVQGGRSASPRVRIHCAPFPAQRSVPRNLPHNGAQ